MSRIGKQPIVIPEGVSVDIAKDAINVTGPKGSLSQFMLPGIKIRQEDQTLIVERDNNNRILRSRHGLMRSLLSNLIIGVTAGFNKKLEINGVGYRVNLAGQSLKLSVGLSHEVTYNIPEGVNISVDQNIITISGTNKQQVGQVAAEIRAIKKPEPYKGKGIKYENERIIRKSGKSGKEK
ncbi:MAG: 50S ribosomal protein L6 [Candidatus Saccharimonadales bacterium]